MRLEMYLEDTLVVCNSQKEGVEREFSLNQVPFWSRTVQYQVNDYDMTLISNIMI